MKDPRKQHSEVKGNAIRDSCIKDQGERTGDSSLESCVGRAGPGRATAGLRCGERSLLIS